MYALLVCFIVQDRSIQIATFRLGYFQLFHPSIKIFRLSSRQVDCEDTVLRVDAKRRERICGVDRRHSRCGEREARSCGTRVKNLLSTAVMDPRAASLAECSQSPVSRIHGRPLEYSVCRGVVIVWLYVGTKTAISSTHLIAWVGS